jgi:hypothetical protein
MKTGLSILFAGYVLQALSVPKPNSELAEYEKADRCDSTSMTEVETSPCPAGAEAATRHQNAL